MARMTGWMCGVPVRSSRVVRRCPGCGIEGWHIEAVQSSPYYAPVCTCTNCGEKWDWEEGVYPRPFARGWRQRNIAWALAAFDECCDCPEERDGDCYLIPCEHQTRISGCVPIGVVP